MQFVLYFMAFATTALSVLTGEFDSLKNPDGSPHPILGMVMLILPIIVALLGTINTRLRQQQKFSVCKMASYEIVAEIYKFRVRAMDYDAVSLAAALNAKKNAGKEKKKGDDELVAPISSKERDRLALSLGAKLLAEAFAVQCCQLVSEVFPGTTFTRMISLAASSLPWARRCLASRCNAGWQFFPESLSRFSLASL